MYKTILATIGLSLGISPAFADGYSAPPTAVYTQSQDPICNPMTVQVYFQNGQTLLSDSARRTIESASTSLNGCALASISIVSFARDGRTNTEVISLATGRIENVQAALVDQGLVRTDLSTSISPNTGSSSAYQPTSRRIEVTLAAYRPDIG